MLLMIRTYICIVHAGLQQEIHIILGKLLMLSAFCKVGGGFSILKKGDFRADLMPFLLVSANMRTKSCTFSTHNKVSGINL